MAGKKRLEVYVDDTVWQHLLELQKWTEDITTSRTELISFLINDYHTVLAAKQKPATSSPAPSTPKPIEKKDKWQREGTTTKPPRIARCPECGRTTELYDVDGGYGCRRCEITFPFSRAYTELEVEEAG